MTLQCNDSSCLMLTEAVHLCRKRNLDGVATVTDSVYFVRNPQCNNYKTGTPLTTIAPATTQPPATTASPSSTIAPPIVTVQPVAVNPIQVQPCTDRFALIACSKSSQQVLHASRFVQSCSGLQHPAPYSAFCRVPDCIAFAFMETAGRVSDGSSIFNLMHLLKSLTSCNDSVGHR